MDELPADLRAFLRNHPFLQYTDGNKVSDKLQPWMHNPCIVTLAVLLISVNVIVKCAVMARCV